ncbi:hypothetical protein GCM10018987_12920 [Streptomyces cremeus]
MRGGGEGCGMAMGALQRSVKLVMVVRYEAGRAIRTSTGAAVSSRDSVTTRDNRTGAALGSAAVAAP